MTSNPFSVVATGLAIGVTVGPTAGDAEGDSEGEGDAEGVGVADSRAKFAHGFGGTLAQSLCTPGASAENGLTRVLKLPLASAVAPPATLSGWSQYSVTCSFGRNWPPVTLTTVFAGPFVTSSDRKALTGIGVGDGGQGVAPDAVPPHSARTGGAWRKRKVAEAAAASITMAGPKRGNPGTRIEARER